MHGSVSRKRFIFAPVVAILIALTGVQAAWTQPTILHATESAVPGDVITLQGDSFGSSPQVWMEHICGFESQIAPQTQLTVVNSTSTFVSAQIPASETLGLYAIWVSDGTNYSNPMFINRARGWLAGDLSGTQVDSARTFNIYGRNLYLSGATPTVAFVNGSTSLAATVDTSNSDAYTLHVTAPSGLVAGTQYNLVINNGYGGDYGNAQSSDTLTGRTSSSDPFGIGVPWGADFTFSGNVYNVKTDARLSIHAVGDGVTDDTAALQGAINAAHTAGGGVIYLPAGTYYVNTLHDNTENPYQPACLFLYSNIVFAGDGNALTTIEDPGVAGNTIYVYNYQTTFGFTNLSLYKAGGGFSPVKSYMASKVFAINTSWTADNGSTFTVTYANGMVVLNSAFVNNALGNSQYYPFNTPYSSNAVIRGNSFFHYDSRVELPSVRATFDQNHVTRGVTSTLENQAGGIEFIATLFQNAVTNNTFDKSGSGNLLQNNDGETILNQNIGGNNMYRGAVSSATSTTLVDSTSNWTYNYSGKGYSVVIVSGPGAGQMRQIVSNTTTQLTVDQAWDIIPTSSSLYSIQQVGQHLLTKGNTLSNCPRGIWMYSASMQDTSIVSNILNDSEGIWLRTDYRPVVSGTNPAPRFNVELDAYVADNTVTDSLGVRAAYLSFLHAISGTTDFGTSTFGVEFRRNSLTAYVPNINTIFGSGSYTQPEGFYSLTQMGAPPSTDGSTVSQLGVLFQGNSATNTTNAFTVSTGDYYDIIWGNSLSNVTNETRDEQGSGTTHASVGTVVQ